MDPYTRSTRSKSENDVSQPDSGQELPGGFTLNEDGFPENYTTLSYSEDFSSIVRDSTQPDQPVSQARPRRRKIDRRTLLERRISLICLAVLFLCFMGTAVLLLVLPRSTRSEIEKRDLATFPKFSLESYFSGDYTAGIATFYDDTVPNHDGFKNLGNNFKLLFGLPQGEDSVQFVGKMDQVNQKEKEPSQPSSAPTPETGPTAVPAGTDPAGGNSALEGAAGRHMEESSGEPSADPFPNQAVEQADIIENMMILKKDGHYWGMEAFGGGSGDTYAQALNDLRAQLDPSVTLWSMPAPLPCQFYTPEAYKNLVADQSECFDKVHQKLDPSIKSLNICGVLAEHKDEPIYCRTDHHWQNLGAYYAAGAFAQAAGVPFADISTYTPKTIEGCVGTIYSFSKRAELLNDPETFTYYLPGVPYSAVYYDTEFNFEWDDDDLFAQGVEPTSAYLVNLGGDEYIIKTTTEVQNGRKLLVMKDSYGNATIPFYTSSFQQIFVADIRNFQRNLPSFVRDLGITDVLFNVSAFSVVGGNAENIGNLITQNAGETVTDPHPEAGPQTLPGQ